jgi:Zn ribbon nucleic-acid-binding protein
MRNPYSYIDSRHDELCRCEGCRPQPPEPRVLRTWRIEEVDKYDECAECGHAHWHPQSRTYTECPVDECICEGQP